MPRILPFVALFFLLPVSAAEAAGPAPPDLTGETFIASALPARGLSQATGTCTPFGESVYSFHVQGEAIGPYAGTFVEETARSRSPRSPLRRCPPSTPRSRSHRRPGR